MNREQLIQAYIDYRSNRVAGCFFDAPRAAVAGFCLQHPAPLQILDNLKLPILYNREPIRRLIESAVTS